MLRVLSGKSDVLINEVVHAGLKRFKGFLKRLLKYFKKDKKLIFLQNFPQFFPLILSKLIKQVNTE